MTSQHHDSGTNPDLEDGLGKRHAFMIATMMMIAMLTFAVAVGLIGYSVLKYRFIKDSKLESAKIVTVPNGAGLSRVAKNLSDDGVIASERLFKIFVKLDGGEGALKAGEFEIPAFASMQDVYEVLKDGKAILYPITVAEGLTSAQVLRLVAAKETLSGDLPKSVPEGSLLPETYMVPKTMTKRQVIAKMQAAHTEIIDQYWPNRADDLPIKTKREAIILASIVEKETGQTSERKRVAAVFVNRLRRGMRLESDPTIIYGITGGEKLGRGLRRSEIDRKTDWNTYQISGLPKTPICNPGAAAIEAVLNPATSKEIFFVADGTGGHVFAENLKQHNKNVRNWRKIEKLNKKKKLQKLRSSSKTKE